MASRRQKSESVAQAPRAPRPRRERQLRQPAHLRDTCPRPGDRAGLASVRAAPLGRLSFRGGADKRRPFRHISVRLLSLPLKHTQDGRGRRVGQKSGAPDGVGWGGAGHNLLQAVKRAGPAGPRRVLLGPAAARTWRRDERPMRRAAARVRGGSVPQGSCPGFRTVGSARGGWYVRRIEKKKLFGR